jgi:hypothetical protein
VLKAGGLKLQAVSVTLPGVEVGSILEYQYRRARPFNYVFNSRWILSEELYTRHAKYSLRPSRLFNLRWSWPSGLPAGSTLPENERGVIRMETHDVPAFISEDYMPPEDALKYRVLFIYGDNLVEKDPDKFWNAYAKRRYHDVASFAAKSRAIEQTLAQTVEPGDTPEAKLRKIYARVQQLRNLDFERDRSEQETRREQITPIDDADELLKQGYGSGTQLTWLLLALARAAGLEADPVLVSTRDRYFFSPKMLNTNELNSSLVLVRLGERSVILDPGTPYTPFGLLPWYETAVPALQLGKGGGKWIEVSLPPASASRIERKATLRLVAETGVLQGKVVVTYSGIEAQWRRLSQRNEDDKTRQDYLENEIQRDVPIGIQARLTNSPDWESAEAPLVVEYDVEIPGWVTNAGRRGLMAVSLFGAAQKHMLEHGARVHPVYFKFPYQIDDDVTIELPESWQVDSVPRTHEVEFGGHGAYKLTAESANGALHFRRQLTQGFLLIPVASYGGIRDFYQQVRAGDEDQAVLSVRAIPVRR